MTAAATRWRCADEARDMRRDFRSERPEYLSDLAGPLRRPGARPRRRRSQEAGQGAIGASTGHGCGELGTQRHTFSPSFAASATNASRSVLSLMQPAHAVVPSLGWL